MVPAEKEKGGWCNPQLFLSRHTTFAQFPTLNKRRICSNNCSKINKILKMPPTQKKWKGAAADANTRIAIVNNDRCREAVQQRYICSDPFSVPFFSAFFEIVHFLSNSLLATFLGLFFGPFC